MGSLYSAYSSEAITNTQSGIAYLESQQHAAETAGAESIATILLVSNVRFIAETLAEALARTGALSVAGVAAEFDKAIGMVQDLTPDMVLIDAGLPDGPAYVGFLRKVAPEVRVVALAVAETIADVVTWAEAGIAGYVPRDARMSDLVTILCGVMRGEQFCSPCISAALIRRIGSLAGKDGTSAEREAATCALTVREAEIAQLLAAGLSNKEIARRLNIGLATTKSHVHNLLTKLCLHRRGQAALWARQHTADLLPHGGGTPSAGGLPRRSRS